MTTPTPKATVAPTVEQVMQLVYTCENRAYQLIKGSDAESHIQDHRDATAKLRAAVEAVAVDAERLDWLMAKQAWIQWTVRDGSIRQCQVYAQDEDENYLILSGADRYFNTPREAIDAAMSSTEPPHAVD